MCVSCGFVKQSRPSSFYIEEFLVPVIVPYTNRSLCAIFETGRGFILLFVTVPS